MKLDTLTLTPANLFARDTLWQSWLDVEAALARAQARIGMIPENAATQIGAAADLGLIGRDALEADIRKTMAPILSLTRLLARAAGDAGHYVHWGATTQNVMQTGRILLIRKADRSIRNALAGATETLVGLARDHAMTLIAGRTNRMHALPTTFGFKVAGWIEEMARAESRLTGASGRLFALPFGGAIGAMHAYGEKGSELNEALAADLGLRTLLVPGRTVNDLFADYILQLALLAMTVERIMSELYLLMTEEIGEVSEELDNGTVGSSTMPQKVNPKYTVSVIAQAIELRGYAGTALETGRSSHEGDAVQNGLLSSVLDRAIPLAWRMAEGFEETLSRIRIHPDRMMENLGLTKGGISAEAVMMALAPHVGRAEAHDLVHHALELAVENGIGPGQALRQDKGISGLMTEEALCEVLQPRSYLGESAKMARAAAELGQDLALRFRHAAPVEV